MRRRAVELDDRAVALLADEGHVRDRHDVAAVHPDEQAGIELGLGFRDRPGHIRSRVPSCTPCIVSVRD